MVGCCFLLLGSSKFTHAAQVESDAFGNTVEASRAVPEEDPRCSWWARHGECEKNPRYMLQSCASSCAALAVEVAPEQPVVEFPAVEDATAAAVTRSTVELTPALEKRLAAALEGTFTQGCRDEVTSAMIDHVIRFVGEKPFPFQDTTFSSQCAELPQQGTPEEEHRFRHGKPPPAEAIRLAYVLLVHEKPHQASTIGHRFPPTWHLFCCAR